MADTSFGAGLASGLGAAAEKITDRDLANQEWLQRTLFAKNLENQLYEQRRQEMEGFQSQEREEQRQFELNKFNQEQYDKAINQAWQPLPPEYLDAGTLPGGTKGKRVPVFKAYNPILKQQKVVRYGSEFNPDSGLTETGPRSKDTIKEIQTLDNKATASNMLWQAAGKQVPWNLVTQTPEGRITPKPLTDESAPVKFTPDQQAAITRYNTALTNWQANKASYVQRVKDVMPEHAKAFYDAIYNMKNSDPTPDSFFDALIKNHQQGKLSNEDMFWLGHLGRALYGMSPDDMKRYVNQKLNVNGEADQE